MARSILYTAVFLLLQAACSFIVMMVAPMIGDESTIHSPYVGIVTMLLFALITIALFVGLKWMKISRNYLLSRPYMAVMWSIVAALGVVIPSIALQELLPELPNLVEEEMARIMNTRGGYFIICLLAPLAEEIVFRGAVLRSLLDWKPNHRWLMIVVSAALFALAHLNPAQMVHPFLMGLLLGWMYERTQSIVPGIAFHWTNNTIAFILFKLYPDPSLRLSDVLGDQMHAWLAVGFSLLILLPAIYQLNMWLRRPKQ